MPNAKRRLICPLHTPPTHPITPPPSLQVVEVEAQPMPLGPRNPHGVGFDVVERVLESEQEAQRNCAPERSRVWKVRMLPVSHMPAFPFALSARLVGSQLSVARLTVPATSPAPALPPQPPLHACLPACRSRTPMYSTPSPASRWHGS